MKKAVKNILWSLMSQVYIVSHKWTIAAGPAAALRLVRYRPEQEKERFLATLYAL
jgi:hypothetical protein